MMSEAVICWISGPVLRAVSADSFHIHEAVLVGSKGLLGEVVRLKTRATGDGQELTVQVFEDTTGLRPGDPLRGVGSSLSVRLGPGLLGNIFDGLLRPLTGGEERNFLSPGQTSTMTTLFPFHPLVEKGSTLKAGEPFAALRPPTAEKSPHESVGQLCLVPPTLQGEVIEIAPAGHYLETATVCTLRDATGREHPLAMSHTWPVRVPRPVAERLGSGPPLLTGQRILDCLFPVARGGKATVPGGFGTGKTVLLETIAKWCNADVIVYLGCGERGNEMAGVLDEFPHLEDPRTGRPLMERMVVIANTSNMPVAAREASIYTGVTVAEYFRDQGMHVAVMADSTSRWAEALREVSGRLGELPGEGGYPAYLSTRLADFYERAARVHTLSGKGGSVTIIGAVSPPLQRLFRTGHHPYQTLRAQFLGTGPQTGPRPLLPGHRSPHLLLRGCGTAGQLVARQRQPQLGGTTTTISHHPRGTGPPGTHGPDPGQRCHAPPPTVDPAGSRIDQRSLFAPVGLLQQRPLRLTAKTKSHAGHPRSLHGPGGKGSERRDERRRYPGIAPAAPPATHGRRDRRRGDGWVCPPGGKYGEGFPTVMRLRLRRMLRTPKQKPASAFLKSNSKIPGLCPGLSHGG
ncbi:MAG: V-type ATP synthase subunit A [Magnetococcus sp. XQGC-1]